MWLCQLFLVFVGFLCISKAEDDSFSSDFNELSSEESLTKTLINYGWQNGKEEVLANLIPLYLEDGEVTAVAWEKVYGANGEVKQINTLEMTFPRKESSSKEKNSEESQDKESESNDSDDNDDDEDDREEIQEMREMFEELSELGLPMEISLEQYDEDGNKTEEAFMSKDMLYYDDGDLPVINYTKVSPSPDEITKLIEKAKTLNVPLSILKYHGDELDEKNSVVDPNLLSSIDEASEDVPIEVIEEALASITNTVVKLENIDNYSKKLVEDMQKKFPAYKWGVLKNPSSYYIKNDISLTISYDNLDMYEDADETFFLYGTKA